MGPISAQRIVLALVLAGGIPAQLTDDVREECEALIEAKMKKDRIPGLSLAIGHQGKLVWARGFGVSDLENDVPATEKTNYRLASISKSLTAVLAMRLVEREAFDLDAPIQKYVDDFPAKRWKLTARHLLSHLGGVRHYRLGEIFSTQHYGTVRAGLHIFAKDPLLHEPGTSYHYTTYGYNLLGAAIATAGGQRFIDLLKKEVLEPAGMEHTQLDSIRKIIPHRAQGYSRDVLGNLKNSRIVDTSNKVPGGGLCSTAPDLIQFAHALMAGKLVKPGTVDSMWTQAKTTNGKAIGYGLGFVILRSKKPRIVGHSGGQPRVNTMLILRPDEGIAVAVLCNLEGAGVRALARQISDAMAR